MIASRKGADFNSLWHSIDALAIISLATEKLSEELSTAKSLPVLSRDLLMVFQSSGDVDRKSIKSHPIPNFLVLELHEVLPLTYKITQLS